MEFDLIRKCRVCLGDYKEMNHLFKEFDQGITLRDIFINTIGFEIEETDGFSPYVCQNCTTVIVDFYNLKIIYEENENQIKQLLNKNEKNEKGETSELGESTHDVNNVNKLDSKSQLDVIDNEDYITIKIDSAASDSEDSSHENEDTVQDNAECDSHNEEINFMEGSKAENDEYQEINTYTCPECGDCFLYESDIHDHMVSKHDITDINYEELSERSILKLKKHEVSHNKCKICNQSYESDELYKQHMETHKKNVCDICGIGFIKKSYLKDHQEIHFTEKRHVCSYCNKAFKRRTVLVKHRRIHTHPRQCICEICGKAFNDKGTLKTHIMLLHVRERNYMCLICGVKFPLKGTLEKHIRRHQNKEREFFCTQCPLGYRDKSSLDRHIYVKHSGQNSKSTCDHCGKQYTTVNNLYKHKKNCHSVADQAVVTEQNA